MVLELVGCNNLRSSKPTLDRVIPPWLVNLHIPTMSPHANGKRKNKLTADWQQEMVLFVAECIKFYFTAFNDSNVVIPWFTASIADKMSWDTSPKTGLFHVLLTSKRRKYSFPPPIPSVQCCSLVLATNRKQQTPQLWMEGTGVGCGFFCSPKLPYLSTMSQHFCRRLLLHPKILSLPPIRQAGNRTENRPSLGVFIQISFSKTKGPKRFEKFPDQFRFLGNCRPTPLISQH